MLITEKSKKIAQHYATSSVFNAKTLIKWLLMASVVGVIVGAVASVFGHVLIAVNSFRAAHPMVMLALPFGGLAIVFLYRFFRDTDDRGTNMVIASIHSSTGIPFRMAPLIFVSTVITHLCGGSAGREGAAIQLGGSIANKMGKTLKLNANDQHIIIMCGMSAGFSALFGTPLAATIFSLEVVSVGIMHYSALVPCVTASMIGHFVAELFQMPPEVFPIAGMPQMQALMFFKAVALAALFGLVSILFCMILHQTEHLLDHHIRNPYIRIFASGCAILALCALLRTDMYLGSGMGIIEEILHHGGSVGSGAFMLKIIFTALTIGAGFKGGEIVPSFCIGAAFGCVMAPLFGMPAELATAMGMIGVFCGVTNCPITSLLISFELFGFEGMPYYLTTVAVSYMLSGYYGLYHAQKIMYSKTETHFINTITH
ncbi:MAG: chloride channel protein [Clostridia bacterium]|nr:chloride channel protein [Clostridia bacterium]